MHLKDNEFFSSDYLESNNQYIASLIDYITANFKYHLSVQEKDINYKYQYSIDAKVNVLDKNTQKSLYQFSENLSKKEISYSNSRSNVNIEEVVNIDYNHYNDIIKKFVNVYKLEEVNSTLTVSMNVEVLGDCEEVKDSDKASVISLTIPLTENTIAIDMETNLLDASEEKLMMCIKESPSSGLFMLCSIFCFVLDACLIAYTIRYIVTTRTAETIYQRELKKILNNYKSYIEKVNNSFELDGYQLLNIDTFTDMLEIRDTVHQPILMVENIEKDGVYFVIPSNTKLLYVYRLKVSDIKKKIEENTKKIIV